MKIKYVKAYQAIEFGKDKRQLSSFTAAEYHGVMYSNNPKVDFEESANGILVYTSDDVVLIGWPNIAFIRYDRADFHPKADMKAGKAK